MCCHVVKGEERRSSICRQARFIHRRLKIDNEWNEGDKGAPTVYNLASENTGTSGDACRSTPTVRKP